MHHILKPKCMVKKKLLETIFAQKGFVTENPHVLQL